MKRRVVIAVRADTKQDAKRLIGDLSIIMEENWDKEYFSDAIEPVPEDDPSREPGENFKPRAHGIIYW